MLEFDVTRNLGVDRIYFSDKVRGAIGLRVPRLFVMTRESTETLLKASGREMSDCQGECEVETGRRLGADYVVSGRISKVGSRLALTLRLHSTSEARLLRSAEALAASTDLLVDASLGAVDELLIGLGVRPAAPRVATAAPPPLPNPPAPSPAKGTIKVVTKPSGARVLIDGESAGSTPAVRNLAANTYWITIEKDGFEPVSRTVSLEAGRVEVISETLARQAPLVTEEECPRAPLRIRSSGEMEMAPPDAQWFRVPAGMRLAHRGESRRYVERDGRLRVYTEDGRIFFVNSLQSRHGAYQANGGRCFALSASYMNGRNDGNLPWLRAAGQWIGGPPAGAGGWTFNFAEPGSSGTVQIAIR